MKTKKASIFTKLVVLAMVVYASATLIGMRAKIESAKVTTEDLQRQIDEKTRSNENLQYAIDHSDDVDTIERVARDLGLVMPGEIIFYEKGN